MSQALKDKKSYAILMDKYRAYQYLSSGLYRRLKIFNSVKKEIGYKVQLIITPRLTNTTAGTPKTNADTDIDTHGDTGSDSNTNGDNDNDNNTDTNSNTNTA